MRLFHWISLAVQLFGFCYCAVITERIRLPRLRRLALYNTCVSAGVIAAYIALLLYL